MDFYREWAKEIKRYVKRFLSQDEEITWVFNFGKKEDLVFVCRLLLSIPISQFIECIDEDRECSSDIIFQYSNLEHAIVTVNIILKYSDIPLTFSQLGKKLINAKSDDACKKYGENHSKLARELLMVSFEKSGSTLIKNTSFGDFNISLLSDDRLELVKRLALRNCFVQKIIYYAKNGLVSYMDLASRYLGKKTAVRRKSNVKKIMYLILGDSELYSRIVW